LWMAFFADPDGHTLALMQEAPKAYNRHRNRALVMPGLVPGIRVFLPLNRIKTWMAGTSPDEPGHDAERLSF
jgi:hypothetical protein